MRFCYPEQLSVAQLQRQEVRRWLVADIEAQAFQGRRLLTWLDEAEMRPGQSVPGVHPRHQASFRSAEFSTKPRLARVHSQVVPVGADFQFPIRSQTVTLSAGRRGKPAPGEVAALPASHGWPTRGPGAHGAN